MVSFSDFRLLQLSTKNCTTMFLKFKGFFGLFQHSAISSSFTALVQYRPLCKIYDKICPYPKISLLITCINQEICGHSRQLNLYAILWKMMTFMTFCGDYYDIFENKRIFISNASWEILNRTFFNIISKYNGG